MKALTDENIVIVDGRVHLLADKGMVCTNGKDVYGSNITLAIGLTEKGYYMITREEYDEILDAEAPSELV